MGSIKKILCILAFFLVFGFAGCGEEGEGSSNIAGTYELSQINGRNLPVVIAGFSVNGGDLTLSASGRFTYTVLAQGAPESTVQGTYTYDGGSTITFTADDSNISPNEITGTVSGNQISATFPQESGPSTTFVWVKN